MSLEAIRQRIDPLETETVSRVAQPTRLAGSFTRVRERMRLDYLGGAA
ncbi:MAG TPA: hypothetical protein VFS50_07790 [Meiothermus sp.]|jgi:hypothetical protein|nr:hypothetical protein [Meiothermus sp.]